MYLLLSEEFAHEDLGGESIPGEGMKLNATLRPVVREALTPDHFSRE
jgi:hypothetical protein